MKLNPHLISAFFNSTIKAVKTALVLSLISGLFLTCDNPDAKVYSFKSDFTDISETWVGSEYSANSIEDWQVSNGRIECLVSNENRNIHLLTQRLEKEKGAFKMKVSLGFFNRSIIKNNKNWAGFSIGSKGAFNENRDSIVLGERLNIGVCTNGSLFIGEPSPNHKNDKVIDRLSRGIDFHLSASPEGDTYALNVSVHDSETGAVLSNISKNGLTSNQLIGDLALMSNFESTGKQETNLTKSTWFKDWELSGSKVMEIRDRSSKETIQENSKNKVKVTVAGFTGNK